MKGAAEFVSVEDRLVLTKNHPSGFDYLRIILALLIVADHTVVVCFGIIGQRWLFEGAARPLLISLIPMFFALSGFLVASSLMRSRSLTTFVGLRVLRIVPALAVDTLFCALIIGVLLTDVSLREYFRSADFYKYFLNIAGDIHYNLPGVFVRNPSTAVNSQLWTIPFELKCYAALTGMAIFGLHRRRSLLLIATFIIVLLTAFYVARTPPETTDAWQLFVPSFLLGVCAYAYRDKLPWSLVAIYAVPNRDDPSPHPKQCFDDRGGVSDSLCDGLARLIGAETCRAYPFWGLFISSVSLQFSDFSRLWLPFCPWGRIWWVNLGLAVPIAFIFAAFSWHLVEKPAQAKRHYLYDFENWLRSRSKFKSSERDAQAIPK